MTTSHAKPNNIYGRALEAAHIGGYTFDRLCQQLECLLDKDRWKRVGPGYTDFKAFLATFDLSPFKMEASKRKALTKKLAAIDGASQRAIARAIGVSKDTVRKDLGEDSPPRDGKSAKPGLLENGDGEYSPPEAFELSDREAAALVQRAREIATRRREREAEISRTLHVVTPVSPGVFLGDFRVESPRRLPDQSVHLVFSDPEYSQVELYGDVARESARVLLPGGSLLLCCGHERLGDVIARATAHLRYWWTLALVYSERPFALVKYKGVQCQWCPVIWLVKGTRGDVHNITPDVIFSGPPEKALHEWQKPEVPIEWIIQRLTRRDEVVVDFCAGSGTVLAAAKKLGRRYVGFDIDPRCISIIANRLAAIPDGDQE
jgi:hypothetical protein